MKVFSPVRLNCIIGSLLEKTILVYALENQLYYAIQQNA